MFHLSQSACTDLSSNTLFFPYVSLYHRWSTIQCCIVLYCIVLYLLSIHQIHTRREYRKCQGKYKLQLQFSIHGYKLSAITTRNMSIK